MHSALANEVDADVSTDRLGATDGVSNAFVVQTTAPIGE